MITILKSGYWKILKLYSNNHTIKIHLREIARQTKLHEPSVTKFLNQLEKEHLLKSEKEGNLKKYHILPTRRAQYILGLFDIEKFEKLHSIRKNAINIYLNALPMQPILAILFGSTAKETYREDSDIDILIITNRKILTKEAENETSAQTAMQINTIQMSYTKFLVELKMKEEKVIQSAIKTGYPLINHTKYYEVLHHERI